MEIQNTKIRLLKPYEKNAKKHSETQIKNVAESIKEFGWQQPIVVDENYVIIIGHCRYEAAKLLKLEEVPVAIAHLDEEQANKLRLLDNKTNESEWDVDLLMDQVPELDWGNYELDWGIPNDYDSNDSEPEEDNFNVDEALEEIKEPISKPGDIWQLGNHRLMCGDSTKEDDVTKLMNGEVADMVFTDPSYGMKKEKEGVTNDNLNYDDLLEFNKKWIPLSFQFLKSNGSWYCWGTDEPLMDIYSNILKPMKKLKGENKLTFRNLITWKKGIAQGILAKDYRMYPIEDEKCLFIMMGRQTYGETKADYWDGFEPIRKRLIKLFKTDLSLSTDDVCKYAGATTCSHWFAQSQFEFPNEERKNQFLNNILANGIVTQEEFEKIKEEWYKTRAYFDNTHEKMTDVWEFGITSQKEREQTGDHATPKPILLCARGIKSSSQENEIVMDLFGGSGSTLIACEETKRKAYVMELEPVWVDVIIRRYETLTGNKAVKIEE